MVRRLAYILVLQISVIVANAQELLLSDARNPVKGYVITNDGDTIHGTIDYLSDDENRELCMFCKQGDSVFSVYRPNEIQGYRLMNNGVYYISKTFPVDGIDTPMFAEFLLQGGVSLYRYVVKSRELFFIENEDGEIGVLENFYLGNMPLKDAINMKRIYLRDASRMFFKSSNVLNQLWNDELDAKKMVELTRQYDEEFCQSYGDCIQFQYDEKKSALYKAHFRMEGGFMCGYFRGDEGEKDNNIPAFRIGLGGEFSSNRIAPAWGLQVMLSFGYVKVSGTYDASTMFHKDGEKWSDEGLIMNLAIGGIYRFRHRQRNSPYLRGGVSIPIGAVYGCYFGAGWEYAIGKKHHLQLGINGNLTRWDESTSFSTLSFDIAYVL